MVYIKISLQSEQKKFEESANIIKKGGIMAYPTDTIYGFGCNPFDLDAVGKIYQIKGRAEYSPLLMLIDSPDRLEDWCDELPPSATPLLTAWPAPLTIILDVKETVPRELTRGKNSLGFRVPDDELTLEIVKACGGCVTSTSVNRSGSAPLHIPSEIVSEFEEEMNLFLDAGLLPYSEPSTIVSCQGKNSSIIRQGAFLL